MNKTYRVDASQFKVYASNVDPNDFILCCIFNPQNLPFEEGEIRQLKKLNLPDHINDCGLIYPQNPERQGKLIQAGKHALYYRFGAPHFGYMDLGHLQGMYTEVDTFSFAQNGILYRIVASEMGGTKLQQWIRAINDTEEKWWDCQLLTALRPFTAAMATVYSDETPQQKWLELLEDFEDAVRSDETSGSQDLGDADSIKLRFRNSKREIDQFVTNLIKTK